MERIKQEPALLVAVVVAALSLLTAFGVEVSTDQSAAIVGVVTAVLALLGGAMTRAQVSPVRDAPDHRDRSTEGTPYPDAPDGDGL